MEHIVAASNMEESAIVVLATEPAGALVDHMMVVFAIEIVAAGALSSRNVENHSFSYLFTVNKSIQ